MKTFAREYTIQEKLDYYQKQAEHLRQKLESDQIDYARSLVERELRRVLDRIVKLDEQQLRSEIRKLARR